MPKEKREEIFAQRRDVAESWDIEYGDRNTQFVIIGTDFIKKNRKRTR